MVKDLRHTVVDLGKALAKLLNIDPKSWSLKWDFSNFITQMGEFSKMLSMIGDLLSAIKDGRWSDAASIGKQLLSQGNNNRMLCQVFLIAPMAQLTGLRISLV
jgi:hypothetical protein